MGVQETSMPGSTLEPERLLGPWASPFLSGLGLRFLYSEMKRLPRSMISQTVFLRAPGSEEVILGTIAAVSGSERSSNPCKQSSAMRSYTLDFSL